MKKYGWGCEGIEDYIFDVWMCIVRKKGALAADRIADPLKYWIRTGRATVAECKALVEKKPFVIARVLMAHDPGTVEDAVKAVKEKIRQT